AEIAPGITVLPTPGHTAGHQSVLLGRPGEQRVLFLGDVVPTAVHTRLPYVMAYDLEPARTLETKRALFTRAIAEGWLVVWGQDEVDAHDVGRVGQAPADHQGVGHGPAAQVHAAHALGVDQRDQAGPDGGHQHGAEEGREEAGRAPALGQRHSEPVQGQTGED